MTEVTSLRAIKFMIKKELYLNIIIVGVGGTGGIFSNFLAKILQGRNKETYSIALVDADRVEKKNLERQPFLTEDIGEPKAKITAQSLEECYGVPLRYFDEFIDSPEDLARMFRLGAKRDAWTYGLNRFDILVGCVDNHHARKCMHDYFESSMNGNLLYMDSGNEFSYGEVVYALKKDKKVLSPLKSYYFPDMFSGDMTSRREESCEALNNAAPQHFCTNLLAASVMVSAFASFVQCGKITTGITVFDSGISGQDIRVSHHSYREEVNADAVKKSKNKRSGRTP